LCLLSLGINTAYRANELHSITVGQVGHLKAGHTLDLKQSKNERYRITTLNQMAVFSIQNGLQNHSDPRRDMALFMSHRTRKALTVSPLINIEKHKAKGVGLQRRYYDGLKPSE
jgi:hypothetical protein